MPKFIIEQYETMVNRYEVEADSMMEALIDFREGSVGDFVGHTDISPYANNELGMSFEVLPEEIDIEEIRANFNEDRNSEYLESIHSIKEQTNIVYLCNSCDALHEDPTLTCHYCPSDSIREVSKGDLCL